MELQDLGDLVAYTAIADGTPVYDHRGRRIGVAEHVMEVGGIFEGVIVHTHPLPGRNLYADADQIAEIHERGVVLSVTERAARPGAGGVAVPPEAGVMAGPGGRGGEPAGSAIAAGVGLAHRRAGGTVGRPPQATG